VHIELRQNEGIQLQVIILGFLSFQAHRLLIHICSMIFGNAYYLILVLFVP